MTNDLEKFNYALGIFGVAVLMFLVWLCWPAFTFTMHSIFG